MIMSGLDSFRLRRYVVAAAFLLSTFGCNQLCLAQEAPTAIQVDRLSTR
jgi:hypothetical protein